MSDEECIHGLGPISACTICNGREKREQADRDRITARWPARYPGRCAACGDDIAPNDPMGKTVDGRYVCRCLL